MVVCFSSIDDMVVEDNATSDCWFGVWMAKKTTLGEKQNLMCSCIVDSIIEKVIITNKKSYVNIKHGSTFANILWNFSERTEQLLRWSEVVGQLLTQG